MLKSSKRAWRGRRMGGVAVALGFALSGCGAELPTQTAAEADVPMQATLVGGGPAGVAAWVMGGGHYQLKEPPAFVGDFKWIYRFSIDARKLANGTDEGVVRFRSHLPAGRNNAGASLDWSAVIAVDCVEVEDNVGWITGIIVEAQTDSPVGPGVGGVGMLIVQDNGPSGADVVNVGPAAAFGAADCRDRPAPFPGGFVDGDFRVVTFD